MTMTVDLEAQVFPMLARIEEDPSQRTSEFPMVIGRVLRRDPDQPTLRHLRSELAAAASRLRGEHDQHDPSSSAALTAEAVSVLADLIAVWVAQADASSDVASEPSFRQRLLEALSETPARPSELADKLGRGRPQISEALTKLTERGLVTSAQSAVDGRSRLVQLTDDGRAALAT